jgi:hypothetical protein
MGPVKVKLKEVLSAAGGILRLIAFPEQQETIFRGYVCDPLVMLTEKITPSIEVGYPPPLLRLTIPPAVDPPEFQLTFPGFQFMLSDMVLVWPMLLITATV